jgi:hypothetical protein
MPFTYGGVLVSRASSTGNPITFTLTVAAKDSVVVLLVKTVGTVDRAGGAPTWMGRTFLQADSTRKAATLPEAGAELWYLLNPLPQSGTLTLPNTNAATIFYEVVSGTASGGGGHAALEGAIGSSGNNAANPSPGSITTVTDGCILFGVTAGGWTTWAPSAQAGTAISNVDDGADGYGSQYFLQSARGAKTMDWTFATTDDWGAVAAAFSEIPPVTFQNYLATKAASGMSVSR